jgi:hypothetical protein
VRRGGGDPFDTESNERNARDDLIRDRCMPTPAGDVAVALIAAGIVKATDVESGAPQVFFKLPPGWTVEPDAIEDRRFFLLDSKAQERFGVFWKAPLPFFSGAGYGSVSIVPPGDGLERYWSSENTEAFWHSGHRTYTIRCPLCQHRACVTCTAGPWVKDAKQIMNLSVRHAEDAFKRQHQPPRTIERADLWNWDDEDLVSIETRSVIRVAPKCTLVERD